MSTPPQPRRSSSDSKKPTPPVLSSNIVTRNGARKAKIQTRAGAAGAKPSQSLLAAKKKAQQKKTHSVDTVFKDHYQIAMESKNRVKGPTGLVLEPRMTEHRCLWDPNYPECPERLTCIINRCKELGLIERCSLLEATPATREQVLELHSPAVYDMLETTHQSQDEQMLEDLSSKFDAIYIHPSTHSLSLLAAGGALAAVEAVVEGRVDAAMALLRPPGHHAMRAEPCGYCFYNNVALAARRALSRGVSRVLIVDWDVHHGQATQQMFYEDPRVVYFSVHRYEHGAFWPSLRQSDFQYVGAGRGAGYNFNVPLNRTGMGDADYLAVWHRLLLPMALEFQPELVLVSAGYDAALGCPEGEMEVSAACFGWLTWLVRSVCSRVAVLLEGGYCLPALAEGAALTLRALLGDPPPPLQPLAEPSAEIRETILNCIYVHKPYWKCFQHQPTYSVDSSTPNVDDVDKVKHAVTVLWKGDETRPDRFETRNCYPVQDNKTKKQLQERLDHLKLVTDLSLAEHPVCYVYDEATLKHKNMCEPGHVECPERVLRVHERHREYGLLERLLHLPARVATDEEILTVHTQEHLHRLKSLSSRKPRELLKEMESFESVYFHQESLSSARAAAGGVLAAVDAVCGGRAGAAVCVVRPPGHHAAPDTPSGFCLLNNAALGAEAALRRHGLRRVLLLDWDVHHGDGTQRAFYDTERVLYVSLHRHHAAAYFPHSAAGGHACRGEGRGEGYNLNVPWDKRGMGDAEYLAAMTQVVLPVATHYRPELVIVSAGFDACVDDPLGGCKVTPECFGQMTSMLRCLAGGRLVLCLEGGYNVASTAYAMTMCTKALLGDPLPPAPAPCHRDQPRAPHHSALDTLHRVIRTQSQYWKCLDFLHALPDADVLGPPAHSRGLVPRDAEGLEALHDGLAALTLEAGGCVDGNCGTDDEDAPGSGGEREIQPGTSVTQEEVRPGTAGKQEEDHPGTAGARQEGQPGTSTSGVQERRTLVDYLSENMSALVREEMFAVVPLPWCPHLPALPPLPAQERLEQGARCHVCSSDEENWVCLHCYVRACSRSVQGHMQAHCAETGHALLLSLQDLSVWCNVCDAYVDHARLHPAKDNAHRHKFGEPMPWCYPTDTIHMQ